MSADLFDFKRAALELLADLEGEPGARLPNTPQPFNAVLKALKKVYEAGRSDPTPKR